MGTGGVEWGGGGEEEEEEKRRSSVTTTGEFAECALIKSNF